MPSIVLLTIAFSLIISYRYTVSQHNALKAAVGQVHFASDYSMGNDAAGMQAEFTAGKMVAGG